MEHVPGELLLRGRHHRLEHVVALTLVLHLRVPLAVAPQADTLPEVVHLVEVLTPLVVEDGDEHQALELAHLLLADLLLTPRVVGEGLLLVGVEEGGIGRGLPVEGADELGRVELCHGRLEAVPVPLLGEGVHVGVGADGALDRLGHEFQRLLGEVGALEELAALLVDDLALAVHHLVVLEDVLAQLVVLALHLALRPLDGLRDHLRLDGHVLGQVEALHHRRDHPGGEETHEVVVEGEVEARGAGVALASGAATELVVDAAGLVALGAEDIEAAGSDHPLVLLGALRLLGLEQRLVLRLVGGPVLLGELLQEVGVVVPAPGRHLRPGKVLGVAAEQDVDASARHVRGERHGTRPARLGDDVGLLLVVLGVEDVVLDAAPGEVAGQALRFLDRDRADEDRLAGPVAGHDVVGDRLPLGVLGLVDRVGLVLADVGPVGGDLEDLEPVDVGELGGLGLGRTGHARQLLVEAEVVLDRDGGERLVLLLDRHALLRLHRLVETVGPPPAREGAAGELVDDQHLAVLHDVVPVPLVELLGLERRLQVVHQRGVDLVVEVVDRQELLDPGDALLRDGDGALRLVDLVVLLGLEALHQAGEGPVPAGSLVGGTRDDERRAGLVDQDRVHLVHDGEGVAPLAAVLEPHRHVVPQVVEAELVVGAVGDVGAVVAPADRHRHVRLDEAHRHAQEPVDLAHPLGVALGQVGVDRGDVDPLAGQGVQVGGHRGDQGLAFTGFHLGDGSLVQDAGPDDLDIVVTLADRPLGGLAHGGVGLPQEGVELLAVVDPLAELGGLCGQLLVREGLHLPLPVAHRAREIHDLPEPSTLPGVEDEVECTHRFVKYDANSDRAFAPGVGPRRLRCLV